LGRIETYGVSVESRTSLRECTQLVDLSIGADSAAIRHEPELRGSFKALRDRGIKITHYEERIG
jgi:hypothetical protein